MESPETIEINEIGSLSGTPYMGTFKIKTMLSRADRFAADEQRRKILGFDANAAMPGLQGEAMMLGQLYVRVLDGPDWWKNTRFGLDLPDDNIIGTLFAKAMEKESERIENIKKKAEEALKTMVAADEKEKKKK